MAYQIQQYNYFSGYPSGHFMTPITAGTHYTPECALDKGVSGGSPITGKDDAIKIASFEADSCYYVRCSIKRDPALRQEFYVKLVTLNDKGEIEDEVQGQNLANIVVAPGEGWANFENVFSPFVNFNALLFHPVERRIIPAILYEEISQVNNLCGSEIQSNNIIQVGIQTRPGSFFAVNKRGLTIGPSGAFELAKDLITVDFLQGVKGADFENPEDLIKAQMKGVSDVLIALPKRNREYASFSITYMTEK